MKKQDFTDDDLNALERANQIYWQKLDEESDLGVVLLAGAYFESKLGQCIRRYFLVSETADSLLMPRGPLGTLGARTDCAFCLRIIDADQHISLKKLARIRNHFAHDLHASFSDKSVRDRVSDFADTYFSPVVRAEMKQSAKLDDTRETFTFTSFALGMALSHREIDVWMHIRRYGITIPEHLDREIEEGSE